jgi:RNA polymerase sigma-70 factor (ECF subfamily)
VVTPDAYPGGMADTATLTADELGPELDKHRVMLTAHCYRMLGSGFEADDAVQETMVRAWRSYDRFEGRSQVSTWLHRIATNVCLTMLEGRQRRARPMELGPSSAIGEATLGPAHPEAFWLQPVPAGAVVPTDGDPAERATARETVRLAFVAALQHLPPRQRAVLILREVLRWPASEVADLLDTSVASVNSALQRARATLADQDLSATDPTPEVGEADGALADRFLDAFERYDMDALVGLLHDDATLSMPPYALWLQGPENVIGWMAGPGHGCAGSRCVPVEANGSFAFGQYRPTPEGGWEPWAVQVIEMRDGGVSAINSFLDTDVLFPLFGLPEDPDQLD